MAPEGFLLASDLPSEAREAALDGGVPEWAYDEFFDREKYAAHIASDWPLVKFRGKLYFDTQGERGRP